MKKKKSTALVTKKKVDMKSKSLKARSVKAQFVKTQAVKKVKPLRIAIVTSRFNEEITSKLQNAAIDYLEEFDVEIYSVSVPGAVEIPITIQALFEAQNIDGAIALGAVIRGDTTHYEEVCRSVERGCTTLMLQAKKPIAFGVLTTENEEQAFARAGGEHGNKGYDAAQTLMEMIGLLKEIRSFKTVAE